MSKSKQSFNKKEKEKKRLQQRQSKQEKMEERKAGVQKGKSLEDMMAYIDENGNLSSTPPDPTKQKVFNQDDIEIGVPKYVPVEEDPIRQGVVSFFNTTKGFGFIKDNASGDSVFFHENQLTERLKEGDKISFETESGPKGPVAVNIQKTK